MREGEHDVCQACHLIKYHIRILFQKLMWVYELLSARDGGVDMNANFISKSCVSTVE